MSHYPIEGRKNETPFERYSIGKLQKKSQQFTLFVLSYLVLQGQTSVIEKIGLKIPRIPPSPDMTTSPVSFFNIATLNGKPYNQWPGDPVVQCSVENSNLPSNVKLAPPGGTYFR